MGSACQLSSPRSHRGTHSDVGLLIESWQSRPEDSKALPSSIRGTSTINPVEEKTPADCTTQDHFCHIFSHTFFLLSFRNQKSSSAALHQKEYTAKAGKQHCGRCPGNYSHRPEGATQLGQGLIAVPRSGTSRPWSPLCAGPRTPRSALALREKCR